MFDQNNRQALAALDQEGYVVVEALSHICEPPGSSLATPQAFVCLDGRTYWVKAKAQNGLAAELIAGRLAARLSAGPGAVVVRVSDQALDPQAKASHLKGVLVGSEDVPGSVNSKDLASVLGEATFDTAAIDRRSLARTITFQTWIGVTDAQVLVRLTDGTIHTIDHGGAFGSLDLNAPPTVIVPSIPGLASETSRDPTALTAAIKDIESLTDQDLITAVAQIPQGSDWQSGTERRWDIARWLAARQGRLRGVIEEWF